MRAVVAAAAERDFHTVAPATAFDDAPGGAALPRVALDDLAAGCARVLGAAAAAPPGDPYRPAGLPALLVEEDAVGRGVMHLLWHRDHDAAAAERGARLSCADRDAAKAAFSRVLRALKARDHREVHFRTVSEVRSDVNPVYGCYALGVRFTYDPGDGCETGGGLAAEYVPSLF